MKSWFAVLLAGGLVLPRAASAQSLSGDWDAAMSTPGGTITFGITFTQRGDTLAGTVHRSAGDVPLSGTIRGDTVTFGYIVQYNSHDLNLTMTARLVRDSLTGTVDFDGQGEDRFWASRAKPTGRAPQRRADRHALMSWVNRSEGVLGTIDGREPPVDPSLPNGR